MKTRNKLYLSGVGLLILALVTIPTMLIAVDELDWKGILPGISTEAGGTYAINVAYTASTVGWDVSEETALTNTVQEIMSLTHTTTGTAAAGIGARITYTQETADGNNEDGLTLDAVTTDVTSTSEDFDMVVNLMDGGSSAAERWRLDSGGVITQSAESAATNAVVDVMNIKHGTSGTEANGIGLGLVFTQEVTSGDEIAANMDVVATDVTAASEDFSWILSLMKAGAAASQVLEIQSTGVLELVNAGTISNVTNGIITVDEPSSATNTVVDIFKISHSTSGTAAAGIGTGLAFEGEDDGGAVQVGMTLDMVSTDVTAASEDYDFVVGLMDGGTASAERFRVDSGGVVTQSANSAGTNAVIDVINLKHNTSGTADDGFGSGLLFTLETAAANDEVLASIDVIASDVSDATEDGEIIFSTMTGGAAATEKMRIHDSGEVEFQKGVVMDQVTADPCTGAGYPEGSLFYNSTANVPCYCSASNADLKVADDSACF